MSLPFCSAEPLLCVRCFTNYTLSCPYAAQGKVVGDLPVDSCPFLLKLPLLKAFLGEEDLSRLFTAEAAGQPEVTPGHFSGCSQRGVVLLIYKLSKQWNLRHSITRNGSAVTCRCISIFLFLLTLKHWCIFIFFYSWSWNIYCILFSWQSRD